jgi:hypothetical protein
MACVGAHHASNITLERLPAFMQYVDGFEPSSLLMACACSSPLKKRGLSGLQYHAL